jgi:hypothetical protein
MEPTAAIGRATQHTSDGQMSSRDASSHFLESDSLVQDGRLERLTEIHMPVEGDYQPGPSDWVNEQVAAYEGSGGKEGNTLRDTGLPIIIVFRRPST